MTRVMCDCGEVWSDDSPAFERDAELLEEARARGGRDSGWDGTLIESAFCFIRRGLCQTKWMAALADVMWEDPCPKVRAEVATTEYFDTSFLTVLDDVDFEVRRVLWERTDLPEEARSRLNTEFGDPPAAARTP